MNIRLLKKYRKRFIFDWTHRELWKVVDTTTYEKEFTREGLTTFTRNRAKELGCLTLKRHLKKRARGKLLSDYYSSIKAIELKKLHNIKS